MDSAPADRAELSSPDAALSTIAATATATLNCPAWSPAGAPHGLRPGFYAAPVRPCEYARANITTF